MSKGAWRYESLDRNTKLIRDFCKKYKFELRELTKYQFRIEEVMDVYPVRQRWHWLDTDERGHFANEQDLKRILLEHLPEIDESEELVSTIPDEKVIHFDFTPYENYDQDFRKDPPKIVMLNGVRYKLNEERS